MNTKNKIQSLLYKISSEINLVKSSKRLFGLYEDGCQLIVYAKAMNLDVKIPPKLLDYYDNWFYDILPTKFVKNYFKLIEESLDENNEIDEMIDTIVDDIFYNYNYETVLGKSINFTKEEAIDLAKRFFEFYDKEMYRHFVKMLDDGYINFINRNDVANEDYATITGITCTAYSENSSFVLVGGKKDITFVETIIHETIHTYIDSFNYSMSIDEKMKEMINGLYEVITYFSASAFKLFLEEIHYDKKTIDFLESNTCNAMLTSLGAFANLEACSFDEYISIASSAYGNLLAFHYFEKYLNDDTKTKEDILNMTLAAKKYDKPYILGNYGLSLSEIEDTTILEKRLNKNYRY